MRTPCYQHDGYDRHCTSCREMNGQSESQHTMDLTRRLVVVSEKTHPHYGCTGYFTGKVIAVGGTLMAEVRLESCPHTTDGCFVKQGDIRLVD